MASRHYLFNLRLLESCLISQFQQSVSFSPLLRFIIKMFNCFSSMATTQCKWPFNSKSKYYKEVCSRVTTQEITMLGFIFEDLATRISDKKLTFQNFLNFFPLTGLWGAKLFNQFDEDCQELITFEEFLFGISRTAKAPLDEKVKIMYLFFADRMDQGISFKSFTKMLYNYSKDQLKQILLKDELVTQECLSAVPSLKKQNTNCKFFQIKVPETSKLKSRTSFDQAYQSLLDAHNEGTYLEVDSNNLTYKVKYSNMISLIEDFAARIYSQYGLDVKQNPHAKLSYENFCVWIKQHKKLFKSYYSAFHTDIWTYHDGDPNYMNSPVQFEFTGRIECGTLKTKIYAFQVGDVIICCDSKKTKKKPIKIICLEGLNTHDVGNCGIQISHCSDVYKNSIVYFDLPQQHRRWLDHLKIYERDTLSQNYIQGETIGNGRFSIVYKCTQKSTGDVNALKVIDLSKLNEKARKAISNQSQIMKVINHYQVVKYIDTLHTKTHEYIITEYIYGEDLFEYVRKRQFLNQFESAFIIGNIMKAVIFLHELDIIHRDLKPENVMVMFKEKQANEIFECTTPYLREGQRIENIKIIDFGLANYLSKIQKMELCEKAAGTPNYIAPEILLYGHCTTKSDVFSIGSILYYLLRGKLPFAEKDGERTLINTVKGQYDLESEHWNRVSQDAKDLIVSMLEVDADKRISLKEAVNHPWFTAVFNRTKGSTQTRDWQSIKENKGLLHAKQKVLLDNIHIGEYQRQRKSTFSKKNMEPASCR